MNECALSSCVCVCVPFKQLNFVCTFGIVIIVISYLKYMYIQYYSIIRVHFYFISSGECQFVARHSVDNNHNNNNNRRCQKVIKIL